MNRDTVIRLAREAGMLEECRGFFPSMERFAALVAAHEREECARVCDELERANLYGVKECAAAIRSRT